MARLVFAAPLIATASLALASSAAADVRVTPSMFELANPQPTHFPADALEDAPNGPDVLGDEVVGQIVVDLKDDDSPSDIASIESTYGIRLRPNSAWSTDHDKIELADVAAADEDSIL